MFNEYSKDICQRSSVTIKIFPYIYQLQEQYEGDTDENQSRPSTPLETSSKPESSETSTEELMPEGQLQHSCWNDKEFTNNIFILMLSYRKRAYFEPGSLKLCHIAS